MRTKVFTALLAGLMLALVAGLRGDTARAQHKSGGNDNASQSQQKSGQTKHVFVGRGSDTARGSRVTITGDNPLNDYSAYRSGDRFYVVLPRAAAGSVARGGAGRGYSDMQVQQRGDSVVLSYRVQPGAKPRVEQKFNRLDVVFDAPEGGTSNAAQTSGAQGSNNSGTTAANENRNNGASGQNAGQTPSATATPNTSATGERRNTTVVENAGQQNAGAQNSAPSSVTTAPTPGVEQGAQNSATTPEATPAATPAGEQPQVAQNQPQTSIAPITSTNPAPGAATGVSFGTYILNNWPVVVIGLVVVGLGLIFAARRSTSAKPDRLGESKAATTATLEVPRAARLKDAPAESKLSAAEVSSASDAVPLVAASALAAAPAVVKVGKEPRKNKKAKKRQEAKEKKKQAAETRRVESSAARAAESSAVAEAAAIEPTVAEPSVAEPSVVELSVAEPTVTVEHPVAVESDVAAESHVVAESPVEERAAETTTVEPSVADVAAVETLASVAAVEETSAVAAVEETELAREKSVEAIEPEVATFADVAEAEAAAPSTEIAPAVAHDPDLAQAEARRLLEGGEYDRAVLSTSDSMARQLVASELLSALAGRNLERRERARAAFVEHGYFDETARDLRGAEAPAERAAAARSLALVGSRDATPHLVAALEDPSVEVRRASVEALGSLRNPASIVALEALIPHERQLRNGIPSRIIRNAVESCREAAEQSAPTVEAAPPEPSTAAAAEHVEEMTPAEEASAVAIEPSEVFEEATLAEMPFEPAPAVEESSEAAPVSDDTAEIAPFVEAATVKSPSIAEEELKALEAELQDFGEVPARDEAASEELHSTAESRAVEVLPLAESQFAEPPTVTGIEHVEDDAHAAEPRDFELQTAEPMVVEETGLQHVGEAEPVVVKEEAAPVREEAPASEWFEFDVHEKRFEPKPTEIESVAHVFEASSGEAILSEAAPESARPAEESRAVEPSSTQIEHSREPAFVEEASHAHADTTGEKGVAPFDEFSTVPASIQHRLASLQPSERAAAITELSHVDSDEAFQQICAAFDDDAKEVRSAAARALYDLRDDRADSFTRALREATPERRRQIGAAISTSGLASEAISQLTGESRERTYEAFSLLFLMAKAGEVQPLIRAIEGHPNNEVRLAVVKLLALSGQKEILPAFRRLAVRGSLPTEVRSAVMEAIYQISSSGQPVA